MKNLNTAEQALINQSKLDSREEPANKQRRSFIGGSLAALAAAPLLVSPEGVMASEKNTPSDPFIVLLKGVYQPVAQGKGPNLHLSSLDVRDGSFHVNKIYPIFGIGDKGRRINQDRPIGNFFVRFGGGECAYQLPGGAMAMTFDTVPPGAPPGFNGFVPHDDGEGGVFLQGTFELAIVEAIGIYEEFQGGHNHMVDSRLHQLKSGLFDEFCFCHITTYQFP